MSISRKLLVTILIPRNSTDIHILKRLQEQKFNGDILILRYDNNKNVTDEINNIRKTRTVYEELLNKKVEQAIHFDTDIWYYMKKHFNHDYIVFLKGTNIVLPKHIFESDTLPRFSISATNNKISEYFLSDKIIFNSYVVDKDYPFNSFVNYASSISKEVLDNPLMHSDLPQFPLWLYIEITTDCNLKCSYCKRDPNPQYMSVENFKEILDKFPTVRGINIIGLGEPMLHPQFADICKIIDDKELMFTFTTNGTIFNEDVYNALPSRSTCYVSLDGVRKDGVYSTKTRKVNPDKIMDNVRKIRKLRPYLNIVLQCVVVKGFINEVLDLINFAKEVNAEIHPTVPVLSTHELFNELFADEQETESVQIILNTYNKSHKHLSAKPMFNFCNDVQFLMLILINGDVYPCCYLNTIRTQKTECYNGVQLDVDTDQYKIGNIYTDSVNEIVNSKRLDKIRYSVVNTLPEHFDNRETIDLRDATNYCKICLARWCKGC